MSNRDEVIILGAGPAGLMCAYLTALSGKRVRLIDKAPKIGGKLPLTGGGKCNFSNRTVTPDHFICSNPNFVRSALARFGTDDITGLLDSHGIEYEQREQGRLFCVHSARQLVTLFDSLCRQHGVQVSLNQTIRSADKRRDGFEVKTQDGTLSAPVLVVATGGVCYPQAGATDLGYRIARQFGLSIIEPRPGLVPLLFEPADRTVFKSLAGVSLKVKVTCGRRVFCDDLLFTHRGVSGPAILQISSYLEAGQAAAIDFLPDADVLELLQKHKQQGTKTSPARLLGQRLPARLARIFTDKHLSDRALSQATREQLQALARDIHAWPFLPAGSEGLRKAETTLGGVDTKTISSQTMQARDVPGLCFIGEVLDVAGQLGGYNLHWAWTSANAAAQGL